MSRKTLLLLILVTTLTLLLAAFVDGPAPVSQSSDTLQAIKDRGKLICGSRNDLPGFGFLNEDGSLSGFEIDFCRALAA
ncbi:MAG: amino acid ABC transporter substrate-binding protein, partial [Chloroflexi bacterium]|nr:amino acid ABC transporter substrate-binding protein [Chloroflexota bacterium]